MDLIADILLGAGAIGAALYCIVLSRRLRHFSDLENGVGGAIATLSQQVDGMNAALARAQTSAQKAGGSLEGLTSRAEDVAGRLELLVAAMHDLPDADPPARDGDPETEASGDLAPNIRFTTGRGARAEMPQ